MAKYSIFTGSDAATQKDAVVNGKFGTYTSKLGYLIIDNAGWRWTKSTTAANSREYAESTVVTNVNSLDANYDLNKDRFNFYVSTKDWNKVTTNVAMISVIDTAKPCFITVNDVLASTYKSTSVTKTGKTLTLKGKVSTDEPCEIYGMSNISALKITRVFLSDFVKLAEETKFEYPLSLTNLEFEDALYNEGDSPYALANRIFKTDLGQSLVSLVINGEDYYVGDFLTQATPGKSNEIIDRLGVDGEMVYDDDGKTRYKTKQGIIMRVNDMGGLYGGTFSSCLTAAEATAWVGTQTTVDGYAVMDLPLVNMQNNGKWEEFKVPENMKVSYFDVWGIPNKNKSTGDGAWFGCNTDNVTITKIDDETGKTSTPATRTIVLCKDGTDGAGFTERGLTATVQTCTMTSNVWTHYRCTVKNPNAKIKILCGDGTDSLNLSAKDIASNANWKNSGMQGMSNKKIWSHITVTGTTNDAVTQVNCNDYSYVTTGISELSGITINAASDGFVAVSDSSGVYTLNEDGTHKQIIKTTGDREGVTIDAKGDIYTVREGEQSIEKIASPNYNSASIVSSDFAEALQAIADDNEGNGFEAITWISDDTFYLGNQKEPTQLVNYSLSKGITSSMEINFSTEIADLFYDKTNKMLYVLDSNKGLIYKAKTDTTKNLGVVEAVYKLPIDAEYENPEALYVDVDKKLFYVGCDVTSRLYKIKIDRNNELVVEDYITKEYVAEQTEKLYADSDDAPTCKLVTEVPTEFTYIVHEGDGDDRKYYACSLNGIKIQCIATNWDNWTNTYSSYYETLSNFINNKAFSEFNDAYTQASKEKVSFSNYRILLDNEDYGKQKSGEFEVIIPQDLDVDFFTMQAHGHNGSTSYIDYQYGYETYTYLTSHEVPADNDADNTASYITCYIRNGVTRESFKFVNGECFQDASTYELTENAKKSWVNFKFYKYVNLGKSPVFPDPIAREAIIDDLVPLDYTNLTTLSYFKVAIEGLSSFAMNDNDGKLYAVSDKKGVYSIDINGDIHEVVQLSNTNYDLEGITFDGDGVPYACIEGHEVGVSGYESSGTYGQCIMKFSKDFKSYEIIKDSSLAKIMQTTNQGFEGICWAHDDVFYLGNQSDPIRVVEYSMSYGILSYFDITSRNETSEIADLRYNAADNTLWILDSQTSKIYQYSYNGTLLDQYSVDINKKDNAESMYIDFDNQIIYVGTESGDYNVYAIAHPDKILVDPIAEGEVVINEIDPTSKSIELYNTTNRDIDLGRAHLIKHNENNEVEVKDDDENYSNYTIPDGTIIKAGDFIVFNQSNNFSFGISASKWWNFELTDAFDTVISSASNGVSTPMYDNNYSTASSGGTVTEKIIDLGSDVLARAWDGADKWIVTTATLGKTNGSDPRTAKDFITITASSIVKQTGAEIKVNYNIIAEYGVKTTTITCNAENAEIKDNIITGITEDGTYTITITVLDNKGYELSKTISLTLYTPQDDGMSVNVTPDGTLVLDSNYVTVSADGKLVINANNVSIDETGKLIITEGAKSTSASVTSEGVMILNNAMVTSEGTLVINTSNVSVDENGTMLIIEKQNGNSLNPIVSDDTIVLNSKAVNVSSEGVLTILNDKNAIVGNDGTLALV